MSSAAEVEIEIGPQAGPQTAFLECTADVAFYGGAAGGGKSYALLLEVLRHWDNERFGAVIFRRNSTQIRNEGGMWDESLSLYTQLGAHPREAYLDWEFPSGARLKFSHLEHERTVYDWHGAQIPMIGFDELTHFTESQFIYMMSRNRSTSGVPAYIRATMNPDVTSWVRKWIDWYIDPKTGFPIPERSGKIRWFIRKDGVMYWGDSRAELVARFPGEEPKTFTFIPSKVTDNRILMEKDPGYIANLKALSKVERERLLDGNWNIKASAGNFFRREWMEIVEVIPAGWTHAVRYWDRAATKPSETNKDPDWTRGLKMLKYRDGLCIVVDLRSMRDTPAKVETLVKTTASHDGRKTTVVLEQDPGSAGVADVSNMAKVLMGYPVKVRKPTKDKATRAKPVSSGAEHGNIKVLRAPWNEDFFAELEQFSDNPDEYNHDDIVDVFSGAYNELAGARSILDAL